MSVIKHRIENTYIVIVCCIYKENVIKNQLTFKKWKYTHAFYSFTHPREFFQDYRLCFQTKYEKFYCNKSLAHRTGHNPGCR